MGAAESAAARSVTEESAVAGSKPAESVTVALAGDTMLGRLVGERLADNGPHSVVATDVRDVVAEADLCILNLECCVSTRGTRWAAPGKPFFFRAPPVAAETLAWLGVSCVTVANNHVLDYGPQALVDTRNHLEAVGIACVGAGTDVEQARTPALLRHRGLRLAVVGFADHPADYAAAPGRPGVAYADLTAGVPPWLVDHVVRLQAEVDAVLVSPHWGPNMVAAPQPYIVAAARTLREAGASLVAGHSAHVFHGATGPIAYDLGDFVDDYAIDPRLRNDLGILVLATLDRRGVQGLRIVPLALDYCYTRLAHGADYAWVARRFVTASEALAPGIDIRDEGDHVLVELPQAGSA